MREISKRKWPKPASKTLTAIEDKVPGFWWLIFTDVNNIQPQPSYMVSMLSLSKAKKSATSKQKLSLPNIRYKNFAAVYFVGIWHLTNCSVRMYTKTELFPQVILLNVTSKLTLYGQDEQTLLLLIFSRI